VSKRRPPRTAGFLGTAGAHAAGTVICAYLEPTREPTPHPISKRPSPHVLDQPLCDRGYDTASVHGINLSMRSSWRRRTERPRTRRSWKGWQRSQSISGSTLTRPSVEHLRPHSERCTRADRRLASHAAELSHRDPARWRLLTRPRHSQRPVHTNAGSPHSGPMPPEVEEAPCPRCCQRQRHPRRESVAQ